MVKKEIIPNEYGKIKVITLPEFKYRRLKTLGTLTKKQYRALQAGMEVEISKKDFDERVMKEVK